MSALVAIVSAVLVAVGLVVLASPDTAADQHVSLDRTDTKQGHKAHHDQQTPVGHCLSN